MAQQQSVHMNMPALFENPEEREKYAELSFTPSAPIQIQQDALSASAQSYMRSQGFSTGCGRDAFSIPILHGQSPLLAAKKQPEADNRTSMTRCRYSLPMMRRVISDTKPNINRVISVTLT